MKEINFVMVKISTKTFENLEKSHYKWAENSSVLSAIIQIICKGILLCVWNTHSFCKLSLTIIFQTKRSILIQKMPEVGLFL